MQGDNVGSAQSDGDMAIWSYAARIDRVRRKRGTSPHNSISAGGVRIGLSELVRRVWVS